jgi:hypothetical protein
MTEQQIDKLKAHIETLDSEQLKNEVIELALQREAYKNDLKSVALSLSKFAQNLGFLDENLKPTNDAIAMEGGLTSVAPKMIEILNPLQGRKKIEAKFKPLGELLPVVIRNKDLLNIPLESLKQPTNER